MKKNILYLTFASIILFTNTAIQIAEDIDITALKTELKRELRPDYKYDSSKVSSFTYKNKTQVKEIEIPLFFGEKYRFLFNTAAAKGVKVEIYNKTFSNKKRKLLYTLEQKEDQNVYIFEPEKSSKMYIFYTIPEATGSEVNGSMIFVLGYK